MSDSGGQITLLEFVESSWELKQLLQWTGHQYEAWITAFDAWNPSVVYSGEFITYGVPPKFNLSSFNSFSHPSLRTFNIHLQHKDWRFEHADIRLKHSFQTCHNRHEMSQWVEPIYYCIYVLCSSSYFLYRNIFDSLDCILFARLQPQCFATLAFIMTCNLHKYFCAGKSILFAIQNFLEMVFLGSNNGGCKSAAIIFCWYTVWFRVYWFATTVITIFTEMCEANS